LSEIYSAVILSVELQLLKTVGKYCSCCALQAVNPQQFIECYIAEQNLVGVAIGAASRNRAVSFASTFACFLSRAYDQLRMGAISQTNANFCGSHCGVSIGEHRSPVVNFHMLRMTQKQAVGRC